MTQAGLCLRNLALSNDIPSPRWKTLGKKISLSELKFLKGDYTIIFARRAKLKFRLVYDDQDSVCLPFNTACMYICMKLD